MFKKKIIVIRNVDQISIANLIMQLLIYLSLKVVNNTPTIGLWRLLTCQNSHEDISPLILMTDLIDIYALLPENVLFLDCFLWSHIYFIRYCNDPTEITRNHFCGLFLKITKTYERCFWDVSETSGNRHLFWDMLKTS